MENSRRQNILLFPFMAQGHIIPFLALAQHIQEKGYSITFVNTPLNIRNLRKTLPSNASSSSIKLVQIPFNGSDHGLPPGTENTDSLSISLVLRFIEISPCFKLPFRNLLHNLIQNDIKPVCVISDLFFGWSADVAHEFGISHAIFFSQAGFSTACYYSTWLNLPHKRSDSTVHEYFEVPGFPKAGKIHITQLTPFDLAAGKEDSFTKFNWTNLPMWSNADAVIFNTVEEMDQAGLNYFRQELEIPVFAIGPILLSEKDRASKPITSPPAEKCIEWLDKKKPNSVIYICFGSLNTISASQMMNLARALDASGKNFIWVLRPPLGFDVNTDFIPEQWLPEGFVEKVQDQDRGLIVKKWAPQMEILAHESVGAFISHCGWNSVLESLKNGVPILGWPMQAEQFFSAKFLVEEVGICVELARGTDCEVKPEDIMEKMESVMGGNSEKGKEIRTKAREVKEMMRDAVRDEDDYKGSSRKAMDEFFIAANRSTAALNI